MEYAMHESAFQGGTFPAIHEAQGRVAGDEVVSRRSRHRGFTSPLPEGAGQGRL